MIMKMILNNAEKVVDLLIYRKDYAQSLQPLPQDEFNI